MTTAHFDHMKRYGLPAWKGMTAADARRVAHDILGGARVISTTRRELDQLRTLQLRHRRDWPAVFSTNGHDTWPFVCYGWTPYELRNYLTGVSPLLDRIARACVDARDWRGGRFFVQQHGAYWEDEDFRIHQFVVFDLADG
jgi:hypothetical protein